MLCYAIPLLGGRFGFFFCSGEGKGEFESPGRGGPSTFLTENPRRGGGGGSVGGGWGQGAGRVSAANWGSSFGGGGGAKYFFFGTEIQRIAKGAGGKGPRQKTSNIVKSVKKFFDTFRQFSRRAKNVKNRQKVSKIFSTLFDNFRAAPVFRPLLGGSEKCPPRLPKL